MDDQAKGEQKTPQRDRLVLKLESINFPPKNKIAIYEQMVKIARATGCNITMNMFFDYKLFLSNPTVSFFVSEETEESVFLEIYRMKMKKVIENENLHRRLCRISELGELKDESI